MKIKNLYTIAMIVIAGLLVWEQTKTSPNIWIQIIGIVLFFYGMMKLSKKVTSKNPENEE